MVDAEVDFQVDVDWLSLENYSFLSPYPDDFFGFEFIFLVSCLKNIFLIIIIFFFKINLLN
jgi:type IV secretory pathway TrbL component